MIPRLTTIATLVTSIAALSGCTSVRVKAVSAEHRIEHICIQDNPKVIVRDFVPVMQEGFQNHGLSSQLIQGAMPPGCKYTATYTARQTWDFAVYMTDAQIDILRDGRPIASANYHLKGKGGFALNKWANTRTKILPVIDTLLAGVERPDPNNNAKALVVPIAVASQSNQASSPVLAQKLSEIKDALDAGLLTQEEYEAKRKNLIDSL